MLFVRYNVYEVKYKIIAYENILQNGYHSLFNQLKINFLNRNSNVRK
jgi:hypothetical protein